MNAFDKICKDIKEVKIQGARNVAIAATKALLLRNDPQAIMKLISLRPTEPALRNSIRLAMTDKDIKKGVKSALAHFDDAEKRITSIGAKRIEDGMTIYTHCHSSTVNNILIKAKQEGKKFTVHCTETRPLFQGRITAAALSKAGIPVHFYVDSAARIALKKADIMLIGADAITTTKIFNKIGSEMFSLTAKAYNVPIYVCTDSWKFDAQSIYGGEEEIEKRSAKEIWPNAPKNINIENFTFEKIDPKLIDAIISEIGIYGHTAFIEEAKKAYPWMFEKGMILGRF